MSKLLNAMFVSAYCALIIQFLGTVLFDRIEVKIELNYLARMPNTIKKIQKEIRKNKHNVTAVSMEFKMPERLPTDLKYVLKWSDSISRINSAFKNGQDSFVENNCTYHNCYLTNDKSLLGDTRYFDALLFDVESTWEIQPAWRTPEQSFIFVSLESASDYPVCHSKFDNYFNLTWTYKLNSKIRWSLMNVFDKKGKILGPNIRMEWIRKITPISDDVIVKLEGKKKAAAWFVSKCHSKSGRENIVKDLSKALRKYNLSIDTYGWCGKLTCPKDQMPDCLNLLQKNYYFYLVFENCLSKDYVTEKLLYPLLHYTVPIVFGGADYSKFLPPGSYINAGTMNASNVASLMTEAIKKPLIYRNYFRWHNHYVYKEITQSTNLCKLCEVLHSGTTVTKHRAIKNFRKWWNPQYEEQCEHQFKADIITF